MIYCADISEYRDMLVLENCSIKLNTINIIIPILFEVENDFTSLLVRSTTGYLGTFPFIRFQTSAYKSFKTTWCKRGSGAEQRLTHRNFVAAGRRIIFHFNIIAHINGYWILNITIKKTNQNVYENRRYLLKKIKQKRNKTEKRTG
jgi:hypothetical protein